jgi:uncharacterized protein (TIGR03083 family)
MDAADVYAAGRARVISLVTEADAGSLEGRVPATPAWTGRDLLAHLVGVPSDVVAGRLDGAGTDAWSARQVAERSGRSVAELVEEWRSTAEAFDPMLRAGPPGMMGALAADIAQHELDLHGLLGTSAGESMAEAVDFGLNFMLGWLGGRVGKAGLGALRLQAGSQEWTMGEGDVAASVSTTPLELFRVVAGRRSAAQVRALDWTGDPTPYLDVLSAFGPLASADLIERLEA